MSNGAVSTTSTSLVSPPNGPSGSAYLLPRGIDLLTCLRCRAPYLVLLSDRGKTLRFYRHYQLRFREDMLREFLKKKEYLLTPAWSSEYSPGGER